MALILLERFRVFIVSNHFRVLGPLKYPKIPIVRLVPLVMDFDLHSVNFTKVLCLQNVFCIYHNDSF